MNMKKCTFCEDEGVDKAALQEVNGVPLCFAHMSESKRKEANEKDRAHDAEMATAREVAIREGRLDDKLNLDILGGIIGSTINGVLSGKIPPAQANSICSLANVVIKAADLQWRMKTVKR
jgi:hypothetical protein